MYLDKCQQGWNNGYKGDKRTPHSVTVDGEELRLVRGEPTGPNEIGQRQLDELIAQGKVARPTDADAYPEEILVTVVLPNGTSVELPFDPSVAHEGNGNEPRLTRVLEYVRAEHGEHSEVERELLLMTLRELPPGEMTQKGTYRDNVVKTLMANLKANDSAGEVISFELLRSAPALANPKYRGKLVTEFCQAPGSIAALAQVQEDLASRGTWENGERSLREGSLAAALFIEHCAAEIEAGTSRDTVSGRDSLIDWRAVLEVHAHAMYDEIGNDKDPSRGTPPPWNMKGELPDSRYTTLAKAGFRATPDHKDQMQAVPWDDLVDASRTMAAVADRRGWYLTDAASTYLEARGAYVGEYRERHFGTDPVPELGHEAALYAATLMRWDNSEHDLDWSGTGRLMRSFAETGQSRGFDEATFVEAFRWAREVRKAELGTVLGDYRATFGYAHRQLEDPKAIGLVTIAPLEGAGEADASTVGLGISGLMFHLADEAARSSGDTHGPGKPEGLKEVQLVGDEYLVSVENVVVAIPTKPGVQPTVRRGTLKEAIHALRGSLLPRSR